MLNTAAQGCIGRIGNRANKEERAWVGGGQQRRCDCEMEEASDCEVDEATDREMEEANDREARYDESGGDNMARGQGRCVGLPC